MTDDPDDGAATESVPDDALLGLLEEGLFGARPSMSQEEVAERAGIPLDLARELWHQLGFAHTQPGQVAFTEADERALRLTQDLIDLGVLSEDRRESLVRTWGRSFARLAEWQAALLADIARETGLDPAESLVMLGEEALPKVEELQAYTWKRHLLSAGGRLLADTAQAHQAGVCFVDIVGYTSRSRSLSAGELVDWLEAFETKSLESVVERGGRIIKNIGDELLIVADTAEEIAEIALDLVARGEDADDDFPAVRAGVAYGQVVSRLGDVYGPVVNIAARLTSVARPGTVLVDLGMHDALGGQPTDDAAADHDEHDAHDAEHDDDSGPSAYRLRRLRRVSVKGYSRLKVWALTRR
ncbi:MAG: adenylate/guanylate cyclase domain-containing protein [Nocardioidaceae bacterium]|nr:adenylate/guanylate cyclase domain-containing protein [Nocardioidaceae bacterium]MCL2614301.1 adenylate/guanylate cyclase domain-containing protein [Nocardioidaceae bacterium]